MMQHKRNHTIGRLKKRYKHLAAALAGVAILSGAALPMASQATAHASEAPQQEKVTPEAAIPNGDTSMEALTAEKDKAPEKKEINMKATAYAPGAHDNGPWGNKTHLGTNVRPGVIAVDPRVIPLGSEVSIEYPDGRVEYAIAEDTGGAIKGNRIDVAKWTVKEAEKFGIQNVKVSVISTPKTRKA